MAKDELSDETAGHKTAEPQRLVDKISDICGVPVDWLVLGTRVGLLLTSGAVFAIFAFQVSTFTIQYQMKSNQLRFENEWSEKIGLVDERVDELIKEIDAVRQGSKDSVHEESRYASEKREEISKEIGAIMQRLTSIRGQITDINRELETIQQGVDEANIQAMTGLEDTNNKWSDLTDEQMAMKADLLNQFWQAIDNNCLYGAWLRSKAIQEVVFHSVVHERTRESFINRGIPVGITIGYSDCGKKYLFAPDTETMTEVVDKRIKRFAEDIEAELVPSTPTGPKVLIEATR